MPTTFVDQRGREWMVEWIDAESAYRASLSGGSVRIHAGQLRTLMNACGLRMRMNAEPLADAAASGPTLDALLTRTTPEPNTGCFLWLGAHKPSGYGNVTIGRRHVAVHRAAWELQWGRIPAGLFVCHRCDQPACCNIDHLFLGTARDNSADAVRKSRHSHGERMPNSRLSDRAVSLLRVSPVPGETVAAAAARLGVHPTTIYRARTGDTWKHVKGGSRT